MVSRCAASTEALAFDDVLVVARYSQVLPGTDSADTHSRALPR